jgi:hypothetical protein
MDTEQLGPLNQAQIEQFRSVAEEQWGDVLTELRKTVKPEILEVVEGITRHVYTGGYMAGVEHMYEAIRGIK